MLKKFFLLAGLAVVLGLAYAQFKGVPVIGCAYAQATGQASASSCKFCPEFYCYNPEVGHRWKEIKKARARAEGLPERYLALWDRLDDCEACVRNAPDWVHLEYVYDKKGYEKARGHKPPFTSQSMPWTPALEKAIRDEMREGVVKEFHVILHSNKPCKCCRAKNQKEYQKWYDEELDTDDADTPGYNKELDFHPSVAISYTDKNKLGEDPPDLTEIPERYKRRSSIKAPPAENYMDPPVREVHVMCQKCRKLGDEYNKYSRYINEERRRIGQAKRNLFYDRAAIDDVWGEISGASTLASSPQVDKKLEDLYKELSQRQEQLEADTRKVEDMLATRKEWEDKQADLMKQIIACEETCQSPVEETPPKVKLNGNESTLPEDKQKPVPDKKAEALGTGDVPVKDGKKSAVSGGACKKPPEAPVIEIGENAKYGTGARTKQKVGQTVGGALMGGLMGGGNKKSMGFGGGGFGGGGLGGGSMGMVPGAGGSGSSSGPKTVKDPVPKSVKAKASPTEAGTEMVVGGAFTDKGLVISSLIDKAPGDGTFHAVYLEDCSGHRMLPTEYMIFELWRDWKLTVWWTHDRWVDGEHVLHEAGDYVADTGSTKIGDFFFYKKGNEDKGIWNMLGFGNAANGIKSLGTVFDVAEGDLAKGPLNLVIQTTLPEGDPVATDPQIYQVSLDENDKVVITKG